MDFRVIGVPLELGCGTVGTSLAYASMKDAFSAFPFAYPPHTWSADERITADNAAPHTFSDNMNNPEIVIDTCMALRRSVSEAVAEGAFPLVIGGDHSIGIGSIAGTADHFRPEELSCVWVDAHTDINVEEGSPSKNIHGMTLAAMLDICGPRLSAVGHPGPKLLGDNIYVIGARSIDPPEEVILREQGVHVYRIDEVRSRGIPDVLREVTDRIREKTRAVHVSYDVDVMEPMVFSATGLNVPDGIGEAEAAEILRLLAETGKVVSMDCVEYNPLMDNAEKTDREMVLRILRETVSALCEKALIPFPAAG